MLSSRLNPHLDLGKSGKDKPNVDIASEWLMVEGRAFRTGISRSDSKPPERSFAGRLLIVTANLPAMICVGLLGDGPDRAAFRYITTWVHPAVQHHQSNNNYLQSFIPSTHSLCAPQPPSSSASPASPPSPSLKTRHAQLGPKRPTPSLQATQTLPNTATTRCTAVTTAPRSHRLRHWTRCASGSARTRRLPPRMMVDTMEETMTRIPRGTFKRDVVVLDH